MGFGAGIGLQLHVVGQSDDVACDIAGGIRPLWSGSSDRHSCSQKDQVNAGVRQRQGETLTREGSWILWSSVNYW